MPSTPIILASGSVYRKTLLQRLQLPFAVDSPDIDETPHPLEAPRELAARLALAKTQALKARYPSALIIGSDQTAECEGTLLGKPHTPTRALEQLSFCSGKQVTFYTGLCLLDTQNNRFELDIVPFRVSFLPLTQPQIQHYIKKEQVLDCAGSFKCEGLGIALFRELEGTDPTALEGLPLIRLSAMLRAAGIEPLS